MQYKYPQTSKFRRKYKTHFTLNSVQNWTSLINMTNQRLKNILVCRSESEGWQGDYNKILERCKNSECYVSKKIQ